MGLDTKKSAIAFTCPYCSECYEAELRQSGQLVRCWCGMTMRVPDEHDQVLQEAGQSQQAQTVKMSADMEDQLVRPCPRCRYLLESDVMVCMKCGYDRVGGKVLQTETDATAKEQPMEIWNATWPGRLMRWKMWKIPLAIVIVSYLFVVVQAFLVSGFSEMGAAILGLTQFIAMGSFLTLIGLFFMEYVILRQDFGPYWTQWLKLVSIAAVIMVVQMLMIICMGSTLGGIALWGGWLMQLVIYYVMVGWYFETDSTETFVLAGLMFALHMLPVVFDYIGFRLTAL